MFSFCLFFPILAPVAFPSGREKENGGSLVATALVLLAQSFSKSSTPNGIASRMNLKLREQKLSWRAFGTCSQCSSLGERAQQLLWWKSIKTELKEEKRETNKGERWFQSEKDRSGRGFLHKLR